MIRIKLPMGGITPEQIEAFADVIEKYVPLNKGHITTRQNIQIHHVPLPDAAKLIRELSDAGLSSREGCGNTVRNVTGDPWAGVAPDELFDLTPYAGAYVRYFVRHPTTQLMPRKIKTAFDGTDEDRSLTGIHDIAFIARERDGVRGVEVRVGGGTSIMPRVAPTLYEFVGPTTASTSRSPRPSSASSTARTSCASTAPAPASRCSSTRSASTSSAPGRGGAQGRLGRTSATSTSRACASTSTRRQPRPPSRTFGDPAKQRESAERDDQWRKVQPRDDQRVQAATEQADQ